jgi:hypothetical protein
LHGEQEYMPIVEPVDPAWPGPPSILRFNEAYALVAGARFPLHDARPEKLYNGNRNARSCALCGRSEQEGTSFKSDSHIIPRALGNRRYFSNEECDSCNGTYADQQDNHLNNAFSFQRLFFAVRGREGCVGLKPQGQEGSEIRALGEQHLAIWQREDKGVHFEILGENRGKLSLDLPPYMPNRMLQALLRSCWLLVPASFRMQYSHLSDWIRGDIPTPNSFLRYSLVEGCFECVELNLWQRVNSSSNSSTLVLQFTFCDTVLIWPIPEADGAQKPSLLPPFEIGRKPPRADLVKLASPDAELSTIRSDLAFSYDSMLTYSPGDPPLPLPKRAKVGEQRRSVLVLLCAVKDGAARQSVCATLSLTHQDSFRSRFRVQGGDFAGNMCIDIDHRTDEAHFDIKLLLDILPASEGSGNRPVVA